MLKSYAAGEITIYKQARIINSAPVCILEGRLV